MTGASPSFPVTGIVSDCALARARTLKRTEEMVKACILNEFGASCSEGI